HAPDDAHAGDLGDARAWLGPGLGGGLGRGLGRGFLFLGGFFVVLLVAPLAFLIVSLVGFFVLLLFVFVFVFVLFFVFVLALLVVLAAFGGVEIVAQFLAIENASCHKRLPWMMKWTCGFC